MIARRPRTPPHARGFRELLSANPHNLEPKASLQRAPTPPALPRLRELARPTLITVGAHDVADVHAHAGAIEASIPDARRLVLADSGHLAQLEAPDSFNQSTIEFLSTAV
jgi:3-oxoadipate enol-lactonase